MIDCSISEQRMPEILTLASTSGRLAVSSPCPPLLDSSLNLVLLSRHFVGTEQVCVLLLPVSLGHTNQRVVLRSIFNLRWSSVLD